jgi:hypothetical protein
MMLAIHVTTTFGVASLGIFDLEAGNGGPEVHQKWLALSVSAALVLVGAGLVANFLRALFTRPNSRMKGFSVTAGFVFTTLLVIGLSFWKNTEAFSVQFLSSHAYSLGAGVVASAIYLIVAARDNAPGSQ